MSTTMWVKGSKTAAIIKFTAWPKTTITLQFSLRGVFSIDCIIIHKETLGIYNKF